MKNRQIKDTYMVYECIRRAFLLGLNIKPILNALDAKSGDRILDAGCGFGFFSKYLVDCGYVGIDSDPKRIKWAIKNIGETPRRKFIIGDIRHTSFSKNSFNKALCYGLLHHLSDSDVKLCLMEISRVVTDKIVFSDPVYSKFHMINNLICHLDRGKFVRHADEYKNVCHGLFRVNRTQYFYSNNYLAKYFLIVASRNKLAH